MTVKGTAALGLVTAVALVAPASAGAATKTVQAGPFGSQAKKFQTAVGDGNAYFRKVTTINAGDRVRWKINGFHSVTFTPPGGPRPGLISPDTANPVAGVNDAAGQPFWFNGQPKLLLNVQAAMPQGGKTFDPAVLENSGLPLAPGAPPPYTLKFKKSGTFHYFCVVHPGMDGTVKVRKQGRRVPSAVKDRREAKRQQKVTLQRVVRLSSGLGTEDLQKTMQAGNDKRSGATVFKFFPANPTYMVGDTVTLQMSPQSTEVHTFTLGPSNGNDAYNDQLANSLLGPEFDPRGAYPSENPAAGVPVFTGATHHGNGFLNSGILDRDAGTPLPASTKVTFTTPGEFTLICLIHPFMSAKVTVAP